MKPQCPQTADRPRVLIAEDNPTTRKLMSHWLESSGYTVLQAEDGSEAWKSAQGDCPPIVVTDWNMPLMSGLELCKTIRQYHDSDQVYLLVATSRDEGDDLSEAMLAGANDFLSKPVREDEFLARIQNAENALRQLQHRTEMADTDSLTGLLNRRGFLLKAQKIVDDAHLTATPVACLLLDVDLFKKFNDEYGHSTGDSVLKVVADCIRRETRESDLACRMGGDEFCVILPGASENDGFEIAERIRQRIAQQTCKMDQQSIAIQTTLSVAPWNDSMITIEEFIDAADKVLLVAKIDGRNRTACVSDLHQRRDTPESDLDPPERKFLRSTTVSQVSLPTFVSIVETETLDLACSLFLEQSLDAICIVNEGNELVGLLTERELLTHTVNGESDSLPVKSLMSYNFASYTMEHPLIKVWETYQRTPQLRNIVVDDLGRPTGVVCIKSLLKLLHTAKGPKLAEVS